MHGLNPLVVFVYTPDNSPARRQTGHSKAMAAQGGVRKSGHRRWSPSHFVPKGVASILLGLLAALLIMWLVAAELRMTALKTRVTRLQGGSKNLLERVEGYVGDNVNKFVNMEKRVLKESMAEASLWKAEIVNMEHKLLAGMHQFKPKLDTIEEGMDGLPEAYARRLHAALVAPSAHCEPHQGIDYEGTLLQDQPGKQDTLGACCEACTQRAPACSVWAWCGSEAKCGQEVHTCVLKSSPNPTLPVVLRSGSDVAWVSGLVIHEPELSRMYAERGMELTLAPTLLLGVRDGPATLSTISPRGEPAFSFAAPHDLLAMNRSSAGFHQLGDISLRIKVISEVKRARSQPESTIYDTYSTVAKPVSTKSPPVNATPIDYLPADTSSRGVRVVGHVNLAPQLPPDTPVTVTRWIELPDVLSTGTEDAAGGTSSTGKIDRHHHLLKHVGQSVLLDEEVRMYWNISHAGTVSNDLELGSLALSMPFDQIFSERTLEKVAVQCSFVEAYPGGQLGYIQITKAHGGGPTLLVLPAPDTPTSFEAWRPLRGDDASIIGFGFEGHHEMLLHSKAYAQNEWSAATPWVPPTSSVLKPRESLVVGIRIILAATPEQVEEALLAAGHPVVTGVPGFVIHADMDASRLFVTHTPAAIALDAVKVHPPGAVIVSTTTRFGAAASAATRVGGSAVQALSIKPSALPTDKRGRAGLATKMGDMQGIDKESEDLDVWDDPSIWTECGRYEQVDVKTSEVLCPAYVGRVRLQLRFVRSNRVVPRQAKAQTQDDDARQEVVQYVQVMVLPPARALVRQYGLTSADPTLGFLSPFTYDPWHRSPAFMGYDNEKRKPLMHEFRVYMAGLSDEAGAAQPLAMAIKQLGSPTADEIAKLEAYVHQTLYTPKDGSKRHYVQEHDTFAIRASMMYNGTNPEFRKYQPDFVKKCRTTPPFWQICWDERRSMENWRAYNYPHVAALYWSMYRLARATPALTTQAPWEWYLKQAVGTVKAMWQFGKGYGRWGLMVGSVFTRIAHDVKLEGWIKEQVIIDDIMKERLALWQSLTFPFGSEMSWDNTGHEEIGAWLADVGDASGEEATVKAVQAYQGVFPSWALSGSARRWWDFFINGKISNGNERVYHHYTSALNAMPLAEYYRKHPDKLYLLRVATAGNMGSLTNILPDGGASMGWHGNPDMLKQDGYSADYGIGFYGHWAEAGGTLACDNWLGWLCFNCDITQLQPGWGQQLAIHTSPGLCSQKPGLALRMKDAFRRQLFIAPIALLITVDNAWVAGAVQLDMAKGRAVIPLAPHNLGPKGATNAPPPPFGSESMGNATVAVVTVRRTAVRGSAFGILSTLQVVCGEGPMPEEDEPEEPKEGPQALAAHWRRARGKEAPPKEVQYCENANRRGPGAVNVPLGNHASGRGHVIVTWTYVPEPLRTKSVADSRAEALYAGA